MARAWRGVAIVFAIATLGILTLAEGAPPVVLQWMAPLEECPDAPYVYGEIARLLGGGARESDSNVTAKATVVHVKDGLWRVVLTTKSTPSAGGASSEGSRTVEADSCRSLTDATALILALTINPERVAETAASSSSSATVGSASSSSPTASVSAVSSATTVVPEASSVAPISVSNASTTPAAHGPSVGVSFLVGGALDLGTLPVVAVGLGATIEARLDRLRFDVVGLWSPKRRATLVNRPTAGGDFDLLALGARVGVSLLDPGLLVELAPTLAFAWSRVHGSGFGIDHPSDASIDSFAVGPGGYAALRLTSPVFLRLQLDALFPFRHPDFVLDAIGDVHAMPTVVGRVQLGLEARF